MPGSYEEVDFRIRPAKNIERKMMCEAFSKLENINDVSEYRYIGFGATTFSDFILFHERLGIDDMKSIEADDHNKARFKFNKPFHCIDMKYGESSEILPTLDFNKPVIIWLDYDEVLQGRWLRDIQRCCDDLAHGSVLLITVDATPISQRVIESEHDSPSKLLKSDIGGGSIEEYTKRDEFDGFNGWNTARLYRTIIDNEIRRVVCERNRLEKEDNEISYKQLFNFHYRDSSRMLTVGGIFYLESESDFVEDCNFDNLNFVSHDETPFLIDVPILTLQEARVLNEELPRGDLDEVDFDILDREKIEKYSRIYRYFPKFSETEL